MKRWTQRTWIKIIAVALSLSLIAAAVALVLSGTGVSWTGWAETVSRPFSRLAATVTGWAEQGAAYFQGVETLQAEKAALEKEVAQLQAAARAGDFLHHSFIGAAGKVHASSSVSSSVSISP